MKDISQNKLGQATLEYVLMLVIGVIIAGNLLSQFSAPFQTYTQGILTYRTCLLATGSIVTTSENNCGLTPFIPGSGNWGSSVYPSGSYSGGSYSGGSYSGGSYSGGSYSGGSYSGGSYSGGSYSGGSYGSNPYGSNPYGSNPYGSNPYGSNPYGSNPYGSNPYGSNPYGSNPYGSNTYDRGPNTPYNFESASLSNDPSLFPNSSAQNNSSQSKNRFQDSSLNADPFQNSRNSDLFEDLSDESSRMASSNKRNKKKKKKRSKQLTSASVSVSLASNNSPNNNGSYLISSASIGESEEQERKDLFASNVNASKNSSPELFQSNKRNLLLEERSQSKEEIKDEPMTFGKFIRYIIIGILVLSILFFVFSRFMEISENLKST